MYGTIHSILQQALIDTLGSQLLEQLENLEDSSSCPSPARRKGDQQAEMCNVIVNPLSGTFLS